jgi:hypothetical protein
MSTRAEVIAQFCYLPFSVVLALSPLAVLAHGGPPSALGLIAADESGPAVVLLNEGLTFRTPTAWSYLCPSIWGELSLSSGKLPLARSADGVSTWIVGVDGLYLLRDQQIAAPQRPEFGRNNMIALANDAQYVYGLHFTGSQSTEVVRLSADVEPALWVSSEYWSAIATSAAGIHLARVAGENQLELVTLDRQGQEKSRAQAALPITPFEMQLHTKDERVYVTATDGKLALVGYFDADAWKEVLQAKPPILGPQASADGTLWLAIAGQLGRLQSDKVEPEAESRTLTCLEEWNNWQYACLGPDLHRLTSEGIGDRIFSLDGMHAPDPRLVMLLARDSCDQQWTIYSFDAMRSGLTFMEWPAPNAEAQAGSTVAGSGAALSARAGASGTTPNAGEFSVHSASTETDTLLHRREANRWTPAQRIPRSVWTGELRPTRTQQPRQTQLSARAPPLDGGGTILRILHERRIVRW